MFQVTFIAVGFMALATSVLATLERFDKASKLVWSLMGMILWGVWALQSPNVEAATGGSVVAAEYQSLLVVGGLFASLMFLTAIMRIFELFKAQ